jgi:hypothetical protein
MKFDRKNRWRSGILLLGLLMAGPVAAADDVYDFEIVMFERPGGDYSEDWPAAPGQPERSAAVARLDALPGSGRKLGPVAYTLKKKGMIVHEHRSWNQVPRGRGSNAWYWIDDGRLSGLIRVTRGRYLHLETDLVLRDADSSFPYRVQLHRRMRSGELHYVDHPKLGIVIRADRRPSPSTSQGAADASNGEPKPAEPLAAPPPG